MRDPGVLSRAASSVGRRRRRLWCTRPCSDLHSAARATGCHKAHTNPNDLPFTFTFLEYVDCLLRSKVCAIHLPSLALRWRGGVDSKALWHQAFFFGCHMRIKWSGPLSGVSWKTWDGLMHSPLSSSWHVSQFYILHSSPLPGSIDFNTGNTNCWLNRDVLGCIPSSPPDFPQYFSW